MFSFRQRKKRIERSRRRSNDPKLVLIRQIVVGILLILLVAGIGTGVWYGSRVTQLTIVEVDVIGGETVDHEIVRSLAAAQLQGEYYRLVPKRFAWTYPKQAIEDSILALERVKHVYLERSSGSSLTVVFEEHVPYALWCETVESIDCLFLDRQGFAFGVAPQLQGSAFLRFSSFNQTPTLEETPFVAEFIQTTTEFIDAVYDDLGLNIIQVERTGGEELLYHIAGGGQLKVSERLSHAETLENLVTLLTSDAFSHIEPGKFQYIDLRYGNKVFVNEELAPADASVASSTATSTDS